MSTLYEDLAALTEEAICIHMRWNAAIEQLREATERAREQEGRDERQLVMEMAA